MKRIGFRESAESSETSFQGLHLIFYCPLILVLLFLVGRILTSYLLCYHQFMHCSIEAMLGFEMTLVPLLKNLSLIHSRE